MDENQVIEQMGDAVDTLMTPVAYTSMENMEVKAVNVDEREVLHRITSRARDRMNDVVEPKGLDLKSFKANPVVLVNHDYSVESVIGRSVMLDVNKEEIGSRTKYMDTPLADASMKLAMAKLGGWSIGFAPTARHSVKAGKELKCKSCMERFDELTEGKEPGDYVEGMYGIHYTGGSLMEYSSVAIPANQEIVNEAVRSGVPEAMVTKFFNVTEERIEVSTPAGGPTVPEVAQPTSGDSYFGTGVVAEHAAPRIDDIGRRLARNVAGVHAAELMREKL
jgi:hypothetical protein